MNIADAALVENQQGQAVVVQRQSYHGSGKGAVVGAVVGILFPPPSLPQPPSAPGGGAADTRE